MNLNEIIACLSSENLTEVPVDAFLSARELWPELLPVIDELMQRFIVEEYLENSELNLLFFGIFLIIDRKQFSCFEALINLTNKDDFDSEDLSTAYYILAHGKPEALCGIVLYFKITMYIESCLRTIFH